MKLCISVRCLFLTHIVLAASLSTTGEDDPDGSRKGPVTLPTTPATTTDDATPTVSKGDDNLSTNSSPRSNPQTKFSSATTAWSTVTRTNNAETKVSQFTSTNQELTTKTTGANEAGLENMNTENSDVIIQKGPSNTAEVVRSQPKPVQFDPEVQKKPPESSQMPDVDESVVGKDVGSTTGPRSQSSTQSKTVRPQGTDWYYPSRQQNVTNRKVGNREIIKEKQTTERPGFVIQKGPPDTAEIYKEDVTETPFDRHIDKGPPEATRNKRINLKSTNVTDAIFPEATTSLGPKITTPERMEQPTQGGFMIQKGPEGSQETYNFQPKQSALPAYIEKGPVQLETSTIWTSSPRGSSSTEPATVTKEPSQTLLDRFTNLTTATLISSLAEVTTATSTTMSSKGSTAKLLDRSTSSSADRFTVRLSNKSTVRSIDRSTMTSKNETTRALTKSPPERQRLPTKSVDGKVTKRPGHPTINPLEIVHKTHAPALPSTTSEERGPSVYYTTEQPEPATAPPCADDSDCDANAKCVNAKCQCNEGFSGNGAVCVEECSCRIRGDPIVDMFDFQFCMLPPNPKDKKFLLTKYRMTENDPCSLMVEVMTSLGEAQGRVLQGATMPRYIDVWFGGQILRFDQQMMLTIGGKDIALPFDGQGFTVVRTGNFVVLDAKECGVQVGFEGTGLTSIATIRVPGEYGPELTGMCGNCDGVQNDFKTADGTNVSEDPKKCDLIATSYLADVSKDKGFKGL